MKKLLGLALASLSAGVVFAGGGGLDVQPELTSINPGDTGLYDDSPESTYAFDTGAVITAVSKPSSIIQVQCDVGAILRSLGVTGSSYEIFNVGVSNKDRDMTFDLRGCVMYASKRNYAYPTLTKEVLTSGAAIAFAKSFMANNMLKTFTKLSVGDPVITSRWSSDPMPIDDTYVDTGATTDTSIRGPINITPANPITPTSGTAEKRRAGITVTFPFKLAGRGIYTNYGSPVGISVDVNQDGVTSWSIALLPFHGQAINATKLSATGVVAFVTQWGNSPAYSNGLIHLSTPEQVFVATYDYSNNLTNLRLSSGIKMVGDRIDTSNNSNPYTMVISDYLSGNNNPPVIMYK